MISLYPVRTSFTKSIAPKGSFSACTRATFAMQLSRLGWGSERAQTSVAGRFVRLHLSAM